MAGVLAAVDQNQRTTRGHPPLSWGLHAKSVEPRVKKLIDKRPGVKQMIFLQFHDISQHI